MPDEMIVRRRTLLLAAVLAGAASGPPTRPGEAQITIDNFTFSPAQLTIPAGTRVTWTNHDDIPHAVVSRDDPARMKSPVLDTDDSFGFTFATPGTYGYFCSLHPHMQGTVIVR